MSCEKQNQNFKILYVLGMLFVLCGHFGSNILTLKGIFPYDTFHIPMFIFASGYFYKEKYNNDIKSVMTYCKKKILHLLIPYYIWNLVYYIGAYVLQRTTAFHIFYQEEFNIRYFLVEPFRLASGAGYNVAAWFLMALFLCQICNVLMRYILSKQKVVDVNWIMLAITCVLAVLAIRQSCRIDNALWEISLHRTMYLLFYFNLGHIYKEVIEPKVEQMNDIIAIGACIGSNLLLIYVCGNVVPICYNMTFDGTLNPIYYMLRAMIGICFWLRIAKIITRYFGVNPVCLYFANHTFSLMMHQGMAGILINGLLIKILHKEMMLDTYHTQIWFNALSGVKAILLPISISVFILVCVKIYDMLQQQVMLLLQEKRT